MNDKKIIEGMSTEIARLTAERNLAVKTSLGDNQRLRDEIARLTAEVERLGRCLRVAAGMLSTTEGLTGRHPEDVLAYIEAAEVAGRALDGEIDPGKSANSRHTEPEQAPVGEWESGGKAYDECPDCIDGIAPKGGDEGSTRYVCPTCGGSGRKG